MSIRPFTHAFFAQNDKTKQNKTIQIEFNEIKKLLCKRIADTQWIGRCPGLFETKPS